MKETEENRVWRGIPASPGIAIGRVYLLDRVKIEIREETIDQDQIQEEIVRLEKGLDEAKREILKLKDNVAKKLGSEQARIFSAHFMILEDEVIKQKVLKGIKQEKKNAEFIYNRVIQESIQAISSSKNEYLKERVADISAVSTRVLNKLLGLRQQPLESLQVPGIVVARSLSPGDVVLMRKESVLGFATDTGGRTSHVVLLAKSLGFPAVVGLKDFFSQVRPGEKLILDGDRGEIILSPDDITLKNYQIKKEKLLQREQGLLELTELVAETRDRKKVELSANIELPSDVESAIKNGADGVGLFRTEYLYLTRADLPGEEEQYKIYFDIAQRLHPKNLIIRTFDMGGDKFTHVPEKPYEANPFLGWRAIRACLDLPEVFKTQLRAILKASSLRNIYLMLPMISSLEELLRAKEVLERVKVELREKNISFDEKLKLGIMIEVPSAALEADSLAKECDFFSIGTNDLIQYTLAVDRTNERIAHLYQSFHPSVLKLIKTTIDQGHENNIWVGMCGEMAADPKAIVLLIGLGIDELSTSPLAIPRVKKIVRTIEFKDAQELAAKVMEMKNSREVEKLLEDDYYMRFGRENYLEF